MATRSPYSVLQDVEQRCRAHARGLPAGEQVDGDWVGIGFDLCGETLIARMSEINEILPPPETIRIPGVLPWVRGLANVRGSLIPVVDVQALLSGEYIQPGNEGFARRWFRRRASAVERVQHRAAGEQRTVYQGDLSRNEEPAGAGKVFNRGRVAMRATRIITTRVIWLFLMV